MNTRCFAMIAALCFSATAAADGAVLFRQHNCNACHAIAAPSAGPSVQDIVARYRGVRDAQARLEAKTRRGGAGSFGPMPMPVTPKTVSDDDIRIIVSWMLSQK